MFLFHDELLVLFVARNGSRGEAGGMLALWRRNKPYAAASTFLGRITIFCQREGNIMPPIAKTPVEIIINMIAKV